MHSGIKFAAVRIEIHAKLDMTMQIMLAIVNAQIQDVQMLPECSPRLPADDYRLC